jgi:hypothetical protein
MRIFRDDFWEFVAAIGIFEEKSLNNFADCVELYYGFDASLIETRITRCLVQAGIRDLPDSVDGKALVRCK